MAATGTGGVSSFSTAWLPAEADEELLPHDPVAPASISQLSTTDMLADMKSTLRAARERQEEEAPAAQEEEPNAEPAAAWPSNLARMLKSMGVAPK